MAEKECWTVATGMIDIFRKESRDVAKFVKKQEGFVGVHMPDEHHILWLFDSENNAKKCRNLLLAKGARCGTNICQVFVDEKYLEPWGKKDG